MIASGAAADDVDGNRLALQADGLIIEIEEVTRTTLEEVGGAPYCKLVVANGKSAGGKGVHLARSGVELELVVGYDGTNASLCISENTVFQSSNKASIRTALRKV